MLSNPDLLRKGLKLSHLRLAEALLEHGQLSTAARHLGISQPAASRLAAEIESITGSAPYERSGRSIRLTPEGRALAIRARRVLREIDEAGREIAQLGAGSFGRVSIGAVTGPAIEHVLPMVRNSRITSPNIRLEVEVNSSDRLCAMVLQGQLDFALARLPNDETADLFDFVSVGPEPVQIVVRRGHPLLHKPSPVDLSELMSYDWVMPPPGQILRQSVEATLREHHLPMPARVFNTASFLLILATISQTNSVAPIARSVSETFSGDEFVQPVQTNISFSVEPYGIVTLRDARHPPAVREILAQLTQLVGLST